MIGKWKKQPRPAEPFTWRRHFKRWLRRFLILAVSTILWLILGATGLIDQQAYGSGTMFMALVIFLAGLPLELYFRLDELTLTHVVTIRSSLTLGLIIAGANFLMLGLLGGWYRQLKEPKAPQPPDQKKSPSDSEKPSKLNGSHLH